MVAFKTELQPVVDIARQRMQGLQAEIGAGRDETGRKGREVKRLALYVSVAKRLNRGDALMPEVMRKHERGLGA